MPNIAIFASGTGSNAEKIIQYFQEKRTAQVVLVLSNKPQAPVLEKAQRLGVPTYVFDRKTFYETEQIREILEKNKIDWIVLAGFLWLVPPYLIKQFPEKIINIHPALLPKYGGKGMYGMHVHEAVVRNKEKETGITIHYANENFDEGKVIFQAKCEVLPYDTPESIAQKVHQLEYTWFAPILEKLILETQ
ncbi:MAG: phosphoribosylglycinamide formyltransferase [Microscillaceae bacterium]|nr:phosphoribosylglycinamide formyltransferase [Microscillaceae bacterium]MDW8459887.1 phosphoribosylglycinamide formyltransferase [Cytophagales bacterium]